MYHDLLPAQETSLFNLLIDDEECSRCGRPDAGRLYPNLPWNPRLSWRLRILDMDVPGGGKYGLDEAPQAAPEGGFLRRAGLPGLHAGAARIRKGRSQADGGD